MDSKKTVPFQRNQFQKVTDILGSRKCRAVAKFGQIPRVPIVSRHSSHANLIWIHGTDQLIATTPRSFRLSSKLCLNIIRQSGIMAQEALMHPYFSEAPQVSMNVFHGHKYNYPVRRITVEDIDIKGAAYTGSSNKRNVAAADDRRIREETQVELRRSN